MHSLSSFFISLWRYFFIAILMGLYASSSFSTPATPAAYSSLDRNTFIRIIAGEVLLQQGDFEKGLPIFLKAASSQKSEALFERAVDLCLEKQNNEAALQATEQWVAHFPQSQYAALRLWQLQLSLYRFNDVAQGLTRVLQLSSPEEQIRLIRALPDLFNIIQDSHQRIQITQQALQPFKTNTTVEPFIIAIISQMQWDAGLYQESLSQARLATHRYPEFEHTWLLVALNLSRLDLSAQITSELSAQTKDTEKTIEAKTLALSRFFTLNNDLSKAYQTLEQGVKRLPQNNVLAYEQAMMAHQLQQYATMENLLKGIISRDKKNTQALNALGYFWADQNIHLEKAQSLIQKALSVDPQNAQFLDSLGWVQFRLGQLEQAQKTLEQAMSISPDPEIAAHWGEVLWTLNQKDKAEQAWRQGLFLNAQHPELLKTIRRLLPSLLP